MEESYQITSQNDLERKGGMRDAFITVSSGDPFSLESVELAEWVSFFG